MQVGDLMVEDASFGRKVSLMLGGASGGFWGQVAAEFLRLGSEEEKEASKWKGSLHISQIPQQNELQ